jgi:hypothetical protein
MQRNLIVMKHKGHIIPTGFVELLANVPQLSNYSLLAPSEGSFMLEKWNNEPFSMQDFNETQEYLKDIPMLASFGIEYPAGFLADDIQPFSILEKDKEVLLAAFASGSFPSFYQEKSSHSNDFFLANFLQQQIKPVFDACGGDIQKLMAKLRESQLKMLVEMTIVNQGIITFASNTGDVVSFQKGNPVTEFPWGWTTDHLGFVEKTAPEPVVEEPKGMLGRLKAKMGNVPDTSARRGKVEEKKEEPKSQQTLIKAPQNQPKEDVKASAAVVQLPQNGVRKVKCPSHVKGNKSIREYYTKNAGFLPQNWKARPEVESKVPIKDFSEMASAISNKEIVAETNNKDIGVHHIPEAPTATESERVAKPTINEDRKIKSLVLSADEKAHLKEFLKSGVPISAVDTDGKSIDNPANIKNWEAPVPTFAEQAGMESMVPTLTWSVETLETLAEKSPKSLVVLAAQWRALYLHLLQNYAASTNTSQQTLAKHTGVPQTGARRNAA